MKPGVEYVCRGYYAVFGRGKYACAGEKGEEDGRELCECAVEGGAVREQVVLLQIFAEIISRTIKNSPKSQN